MLQAIHKSLSSVYNLTYCIFNICGSLITSFDKKKVLIYEQITLLPNLGPYRPNKSFASKP